MTDDTMKELQKVLAAGDLRGLIDLTLKVGDEALKSVATLNPDLPTLAALLEGDIKNWEEYLALSEEKRRLIPALADASAAITLCIEKHALNAVKAVMFKQEPPKGDAKAAAIHVEHDGEVIHSGSFRAGIVAVEKLTGSAEISLYGNEDQLIAMVAAVMRAAEKQGVLDRALKLFPETKGNVIRQSVH